MSHHDPTDPFRPQNLRSYVASYTEITVPACVAAEAVTKTTGTRGAINNPENRRTPRIIMPWTQADLSEERAVIHAILHATDHEPVSLPEKRHVERVGEELALIDSESALLLFDANTLHAPATRILRELLASERVRSAVAEAMRRTTRQANSSTPTKPLRPGNVTFPTHRNSIPPNMSGAKRKRDDDPYQHTPGDFRFGPADVFSIFEHTLDARLGLDEDSGEGGDTGEPTRSRQLLFVKEAKAPHKLTAMMIDEAVGQPNKILEPEAIMSHGYPAASNDTAQPDTAESEFWFVAVCAQLYSSMIRQRLRYGVITTGVRYVFVSIDPENPSNLRYSVSQNTSDIYKSPLIRLVSLALRAIHNGQLREGNYELHRILTAEGLIWRTGVRHESSSFSANERERTHDTESYAPLSDQSRGSDGGVSEGHAHITPNTTSASHHPGTQDTTAGVSYPSPPHDVPSALGKRHRSEEAGSPGRKRRQRLEGPSRASLIPPRPTTPISVEEPPEHPDVDRLPYCSVACLRSVMGGPDGPVPEDPLCPNHATHQGKGRLTGDAIQQFIKDRVASRPKVFDIYHPEDHLNFSFMGMSPDSDSIVLKLEVHGHVLLGKAFQSQNLKSMDREAHIYHRLKPIQGECIPVCLGQIRFPCQRPLDYEGLGFGGLLLLGYGGQRHESWGGLGLDLSEYREEEVEHIFAQELTAEVQKALARIHRLGVLHRDVALRNILVHKAIFEQEPGSKPRLHLQVSLIDFEISRTRGQFRRRSGGYGTEGDLDEKPNAGEAEFAEACEKEIRTCQNIGTQWLSCINS